MNFVCVARKTLNELKRAISDNFTGDLIRSCSFKPTISPLFKIKLRIWIGFEKSLLKTFNKLLEGCIFIRVLFDILCDSPLQCLPAQKVVHSFNPASAFLIRNHVELTDRVSSVSNIDTDWMGAWLQVSVKG